MNVKIKRLNADAVIPQYAHEYDAGFDMVATDDVIIEPGETKLVPTGLAFELPEGYEMQVRPRSGVTLKTKLRVQLGTVDAGYRGEVGVIVDNIEGFIEAESIGNFVTHIDGQRYPTPDGYHYYEGTYIIRKGDRIAQAVIKQVEHAKFIEVETLEETTRGTGGFGSSGVTNA